MGFLSRSAENTFNKTRRRAYVPEWFRPFSYVAAGLVAAAVLLSGVLSGTGDDETATAADTEVTVEDIAPAPDQQVAPAPSATASGIDPSSSAASGAVLVPSPAGSTIEVPAPAVAAAQAAATALFTGDFSAVGIVPGQTPPTVSTPWPQALAGEPQTAATVPSGTAITIVFLVDPDAEGSEPQRPVSITVQKSGDTWLYVPLASG